MDSRIDNMPVTIFFCYAHEDELLLNKLKSHLRPLQREGLIQTWHDRDISAGTEWESEISQYLKSAQIILLLISSNFMDSDYCYSIEMKQAMERHERGEACVIPVILRDTYWQTSPFAKLQALPKDALPVTRWSNQDEALANVVEGIHKAVKRLSLSSASHPLQSEIHNKQFADYSLQSVTSNTVKFPQNFLLRKRKLPIAMAIIAGLSILFPALFYGETHFTMQAYPAPTTPSSKSYAAATEVAFHNELLRDTRGMPLIDDPLNSNTKGGGWFEGTLPSGTCAYELAGYSVTTSSSSKDNLLCPNNSLFVSNFALQVDMKITQGKTGGIIFRLNQWKGSETASFYQFYITADGTYSLVVGKNGNARYLYQNSSTAVHTGISKVNQLTIIANGSTIDLFANGQLLTHIMDVANNAGTIGFFSGLAPDQTVYSNLKIWTI